MLQLKLSSGNTALYLLIDARTPAHLSRNIVMVTMSGRYDARAPDAFITDWAVLSNVVRHHGEHERQKCNGDCRHLDRRADRRRVACGADSSDPVPIYKNERIVH